MGPSYTQSAIRSGLESLEALIPGFEVNLESMKASDWGRVALDPAAVAVKLVVLKTHYPRADLARVLQGMPRLLLMSVEDLEGNAAQVKRLLAEAKDPDALLTELPRLLDPRILISVLVTVEKWYHGKRKALEVLEADPDLIRRAEACDVPLEPVYVSDDGNWMAPSLNYDEKRTDWQAYIDRTVYKQKD